MSLVAVHRAGSKNFPVSAGTQLVFGRAYPSDVVLTDASLSREHARIIVEQGFMTVTDLKSTNGTWQNGRRVNEVRVPAGEPLRFGDVTILLQADVSRIHGIDGFDTFSHWLEEELKRAALVGRPLALLSVRSQTQDTPLTLQLPQWAKLQEGLRSIDRMGMYSMKRVILGLPERTVHEAAQWLGAQCLSNTLIADYAEFPRDGRSLDELLSALRENRRTNPRAAKDHENGRPPEPGTRASASISPAIARVYDDVKRAAPSKLPILIIGETGVGKELIARSVHEQSPRQNKPFVAFNCASVPQTLVESVLFGHERGAFTGADRLTRGIFEQAHTGTLFLDELGELAPSVQAALLRVLEVGAVRRIGSERDIHVDVRIVAATHKNLEVLAGSGEFRSDLLYRLEGVRIDMPPLRARAEEILSLAQTFLDECKESGDTQATHFAQSAKDALLTYAWPGNIRELKNAILRAGAMCMGAEVTLADLPPRVVSGISANTTAAAKRFEQSGIASPAGPTLPPPSIVHSTFNDERPYKDRLRDEMQRYETNLLVQALERHSWNQTAAAAELKIPVRTLAHKIKELGIRK
jgi:two-component system, NtrC family, response regulator AtoC